MAETDYITPASDGGAMTGNAKPYLWPFLTGGVLLFILIVSCVWDLKRSKVEALDELSHTAAIIDRVLAGSIKSEMRGGRIRVWRLQAIFENLITTTDLETIEVLQSQKSFLRAGEKVNFPERCYKIPSGRLLTDQALYYWSPVNFTECPAGKRVQLQCPFPERGRRQRANKSTSAPEEALSFSKSGQILILGLGLGEYHRHISTARQRTFVFGAASLIAIIVFVTLWTTSIKQYGLKKDLQRIKQHNEQLDELSLAAAGLAHEIKNPLGIINGIAQSVIRNKTLTACHENAYKIIDQSDLATERLGRFLNYAKATPPNFESIDLSKFVEHLRQAVQPDMDEAQVVFETDISVERILGDPDMLSQLLVNLLMNSLQATAAGKKVLLSASLNGKTATLTIEDQGKGIAPRLLGDVFKPYVSDRPEGHGIGLSVVKRIADKCDWTIRLSSKVDEGTKVEISNIQTSKSHEG